MGPRTKNRKRKPKGPIAPVGRPSDYSEDHPAIAAKLCELGLTDAEIAQFFEINPLTLHRWKHSHPEFCNALQRSKDLMDDLVEASLFKRAVGHSHEATKVFMPAGAPAPVYADYIEYYPPEPGAAKQWLSNRRPDKWREKVEVSGTIDLVNLVAGSLEKPKGG